MAQVDFFYDQQLRRFLLQFTRIFSGFQVEYGKDDAGNPTYMTVPVRYGDASRQAQTIIANNSANSMPCAPMMSFYVSGIKYARPRVQEPYHVDKVPVRQRTYNEDTESYEVTQGNAFTVKRHMPVPYDVSIKLDIWTTNTNQKWQLFEQIVPMFNPSLEIQSTDNYLDWTSLSVVELNDINYTSRTIPNNEEQIDIMTLSFVLPVWISMPAKVTTGGVIHKVIASMYDENGDAHAALENDDLLLGTRLKVTPHGYKVLLIGNQLQVLPANEVDKHINDLSSLELNDDPLLWRPVITQYGTLRDGISQIRLANPIDDTEIVGTVAYHPTDEHILLFTADTDTLPSNSLSPILAVIDPLRSGPGAGLASATTGQRYMLTQAIGNANDVDVRPGALDPAADAWRGTGNEELIANANDIVEYDGSKWTVVFDSSESESTEYVTNLTTSLQYRWNGESWLRSYEGLYTGGQWSIVI
jgi:hypothetical protein